MKFSTPDFSTMKIWAMGLKSLWFKSLELKSPRLKCYLSRRIMDISTPGISTPDFSTMSFSTPRFKNLLLKSPKWKVQTMKCPSTVLIPILRYTVSVLWITTTYIIDWKQTFLRWWSLEDFNSKSIWNCISEIPLMEKVRLAKS